VRGSRWKTRALPWFRRLGSASWVVVRSEHRPDERRVVPWVDGRAPPARAACSPSCWGAISVRRSRG
jgi:hypothetical protein